MGITISGPSTQIPTNVVEVGNEITQNQLNAITASSTPSVGNPMQTFSAMQSYITSNVMPTVYSRVTGPATSWNHPFPLVGNFVLVFRPDTNNWWPWNSNGTVLGTTVNGAITTPFNFDFVDGMGSMQYLNGTPDVGTSETVYTTLGYWDSVNATSYATQNNDVYYPATGPSYTSNWDFWLTYTQFYDSNDMNYKYRYVYLDGSGGFYTADNSNYPPY